MEYDISSDIDIIRDFLDLSLEDIAKILKVDPRTVLAWNSESDEVSTDILNRLYEFAFDQGIHLNKLKAMMWKEEMDDNSIVFHASKDGIRGPISPFAGRVNNDFGPAFYCGDSFEQPISLVSHFGSACVYVLHFEKEGLKSLKFSVNKDWMLAIAYYRGRLQKFANHPLVRGVVEKVEAADYIIAPIADNRMFMIIDSFIGGEITDEQCKHCLAATNLGYQYVFRTKKAVKHLEIMERCFVSEHERAYYLAQREDDLELGDQKVRLARIQYNGVGQYIDQLLS